MARTAASSAKSKTKKTAAKKATKKTAAKKTASKKTASIRYSHTTTIAEVGAAMQKSEAERLARATREAKKPRTIRPPTAVRPTNPVSWCQNFHFDEALPEPERSQLIALFERFTGTTLESGGYFVAAPDTDPEARRAAWDDNTAILEIQQLREQLPPTDVAARTDRLVAVLAHPSSEAWSELAMLLATWDPATLPAAIATAAHHLTHWPDELRHQPGAWKGRAELCTLVRKQWGTLDVPGDVAHLTHLRLNDLDDLVTHHRKFAHTTTLELSDKHAPDAVLRCTGIKNLKRLDLHHITLGSPSHQPSNLVKLLRAPHLAHLEALSLHGFSLSEHDLAALADGPQPLQHLKICVAGLPPSAGRGLARVMARKSLRTLQLKYNDLGPNGARGLFANPGDWRTLRVLDISANEIGDTGVRALASASLDELRWLSVSSNATRKQQLSAAAADALASSSSLARLETLHLGGHPIGSEGVAALLYSPHLRSLRSLDVSHARANLADIAAVCRGEPVPIAELDLGSLQPSPKRPDLTPATFLRTIKSLNLDGMPAAEYAPLLACPHLEALETLCLGDCYDNYPKALKALTTLPPPPRLRWLDIGGWAMRPAQAATLAASELGHQLWGVRVDASPATWRAFYEAGLPPISLNTFDSSAPSEHDGDTIFRDEI